jgi:hypothetical protein
VSKDEAPLVDPALRPALTDRTRLPSPPDPTLHTTNDSDTHTVACDPVLPTRPPALYLLVPKPTPHTDTLLPPVVPWFDAPIPDKPPPSYEPAPDTDPTSTPDDTRSRRLPSIPIATFPAKPVSDIHSVACAPVMPTRTPALYRLVPKSAPLTLMLPPPVPPRFTPRTLDSIPRSYDAAPLIDPTRSPLVIATAKLPHAPVATLHITKVSDTHSVA